MVVQRRSSTSSRNPKTGEVVYYESYAQQHHYLATALGGDNKPRVIVVEELDGMTPLLTAATPKVDSSSCSSTSSASSSQQQHYSGGYTAGLTNYSGSPHSPTVNRPFEGHLHHHHHLQQQQHYPSEEGGVVNGTYDVVGGVDMLDLNTNFPYRPTPAATAANYANYDGAASAASTYPSSAYYQHYQPIQSPVSLHQQQNSGNYVLQSGQSNSPPGSGDEDNNGSGGMGHTARTPPETLEWLQNNYEPAEGASLPRCTLYDHYLSHCAEAQLEPVNAASFGKLIRSVFKGLRTRRLGTRGNSKYHYNGIRIKPSSSLLTIVSPEEYNRMNAGTHQTTRNPRRISGAFQHANGASSSHNNGMQQQQNRSNASTPGMPSSTYQLRSRTLHSDSPNSISSNHPTSEYNDNSHQISDGMKNDEYLNDSEAIANYENPIMGQSGIGDNLDITEQTRSAFNNNRSRMSGSSVSVTKTNGSRTSRGSMGSQNNGISSSESESQSMAMGTGQVPRIAIPNLDELEEYLLPLGYTVAHVLKFTDAYVSNCAEILENIKRLRFDGIEHIWTGFWQDGDKQNLNINVSENGANNHVTSLEQVHVFRLCTLSQIQKYVETMDLAFYQVILEVLIPHVLRPALSPRLSCQIRNFAKNIDTWTSKVLENAPINVKQSKLASVRLLANALTRYTSFNHLADAVRAVLKNKEQISQMYTDFCKVDFGIVHSQSDWICGCDPTLVASIEREFKENLRQQKNLDEWKEWMEAVVDQMLAKYHDQPIHVQLEVSKQFLLKWSFYSSMILRDFTCRSAESFGSFHLIRLFYDEYLFLLVEMRLAKATNQPIICVMSQSWLQTYQSPRTNHSMFQPSANNSVQQPTSYANNHSSMLSLNGAGGIPTTAYVSTSHLIEPTYSHISSVSSANSTHPHIVIPSHSTSTGIHYVLDNNQSPKYPSMSALISPIDPHSHDLGDILVRDDPSMASVSQHQPNNERRNSFGMETNSTSANSNRYMVLNSQQQQTSQQEYPSTSASAIGTIVYMEEDDGLRDDLLHRTEEEEEEDLEHSALQEDEEEEDQNFIGESDSMMLGLKSEEDNSHKISTSPFNRHIGMRVKKEMESVTNK